MNNKVFNECFNVNYDELNSIKKFKYNKQYYYKICFNVCKNKSNKTTIENIIIFLLQKINSIDANLIASKYSNIEELKKECSMKYTSVDDLKDKNKILFNHLYRGDLLKPLCESLNWKLHKHDRYPGYIYYLKIIHDDLIFYKLGLARDVLSRMTKLTEYNNGVKICILKIWKFDRYSIACRFERKFHKKFKNKKAGVELLVSGNSELYNEDLLNLDMEYQ